MSYDMKVTIMDTGKRTGMTDGLATTEMTTSLKNIHEMENSTKKCNIPRWNDYICTPFLLEKFYQMT
jgi:hypothetical protein